MGAFEAIATIGVSYVLFSPYRTLFHIERRYQTVWHGAKKSGRNRARRICKKQIKTPALSRRCARRYRAGRKGRPAYDRRAR